MGFDTLFRDSDPYTRLEWLDLENTNSDGQALYANAGSGIYSNLIAKTAGTSQYVVGLYGQNITVHGALAYGGGSGVQIGASIAANIYNSVAAGCNNGFNTGSALAVLKNCTAYNNTTNYSGTFDAASTNNATSSASDDAPGASSVVGITSADFVNAAGNDYHLAAGSALIGAGANLYADFQADVDGDAWPSSGAWDIGFDHYVAAGGGVTGTLSVTLENFTSSINGTTTIVGTIAQTMAAFTSAITGTSEVPGTIAAVTEDAVGALEGEVGTGGPTGTIDGLGADFTASMTGTTTVVGISSAQMEDFLSSITGTTTVVGTIAITSDDMIMTANGFVGDAPSARFRTLVGMGE